MEREHRSVVVSKTDLWALQKVIKFHTFMLDDRTNPKQPIFPQSIRTYADGSKVGIHTAYKFREKMNRLLLRMLDEGLGEENLPLDYDEAWYIDWALNAETYQGEAASGPDAQTGLRGSQRLLMQVFRVIYEYDTGMSLVIGADVDDKGFDPEAFQRFEAKWQAGGDEKASV